MSQYPSRPIVEKGQKTKSHGLKKTGAATKKEAERMDKIANFGCILSYYKTGISGTPCEVHHLLMNRIPGRRAPHNRTIGLSPELQRLGPEAVHILGLDRWEKLHGISEEALLTLTNEVIA